MRQRGSMTATGCGLAALAILMALAPAPASAAPAGASATEWSAQRRVQPRPRIYIAPPRLLTRQCVDWYVEEPRPSGTVIVPKMRCWWVRG